MCEVKRSEIRGERRLKQERVQKQDEEEEGGKGKEKSVRKVRVPEPRTATPRREERSTLPIREVGISPPPWGAVNFIGTRYSVRPGGATSPRSTSQDQDTPGLTTQTHGTRHLLPRPLGGGASHPPVNRQNCMEIKEVSKFL